MKIRIDDIAVPSDLYPRSKRPTSEADVEHLFGLDDVLPPIVVADVQLEEGGDEVTCLIDGAHRLLAAQLQEIQYLEVDHLGSLTREVALLEAVSRNSAHGKQLSMRDKQRLAGIFVRQGRSVEDIASDLSVGERSVSRWVADIKAEIKLESTVKARKLIDKGVSVAGAARELGVSRSTLQGWLDTPPEDKPKAAKRPKPAAAPDLDAVGAVAVDTFGDRIDGMLEVVLEWAKETAKATEHTLSWVELSEGLVTKLRASYPKSWK